jgi:hypothetical protein
MAGERRIRLLIGLACLGYALLLFLSTDGYAIDDTWIHLQFARNIASGLGPRFLADQPPVYACSSPFWAALLSIPYVAGVGGIESARLLSSVFAGLAVWLSWVLFGRIGFSSRSRAAGAVLLAVSPWMIRWGSSGMESSAAAAIVLSILLALSKPGRGGLLPGALCGLAFLVRPELVVAGPACAAAIWLQPAGGRTRRALLAVGSWSAVVVAWEAAALLVFGRLAPTAAVAKVSDSGYAAYLLPALVETAKVFAVSDAGMLAVLVAATLLGRRGARRWGGAAEYFSLFLLAGVPMLLLAGRAPMVSRYLLPLSPCLVVLGLSALGRLSSARPGALFESIIPASVVLSLGSGILLVFPHMRTASANLDEYMEIAAFMRDSLPDGSVIAVQEIGIFGYYGGKDLLDLGGLISPQVDSSTFPGLDRDATGSLAFLKREGVTHYLDPHGVAAPLVGCWDRTHVMLVRLREWTFQGGTAMTGGGTYSRVMYRMEWL